MILIGRNLSPFTRRVAAVLRVLGIAHERRLLSAQKDHVAVRAVNPMVRVPVLVLDDGTVLCDSHAILLFVFGTHGAGNLLPAQAPDRALSLAISGVAIAVMEKAVGLFGEARLFAAGQERPVENERMREQIRAGLQLLDAQLGSTAEPALLASIDAVCAYDFVRVLPASVWPPATTPSQRLQRLSDRLNREAPLVDLPLET